MRRVLAALTMAWASLTVGCAGAISPEGRRLLTEANAAYQQNDDARTIALGSQFLQRHPRIEEAGEAYYLRGLARIRGGQSAAGEDDLARALETTRRKDLAAMIYSTLGEQAYRRGDLAAAEKDYQGVLENSPAGASPSDQAMYRLGVIAQRQGRWGEADLHFHRLVHLFDGSELAKLASERVQAIRWSIQVAALTNASAAETMERQLRAQGLQARQDRQLRDGKMMRFVRIGSYATFEAAEAGLPAARKIKSDAFVVPAR